MVISNFNLLKEEGMVTASAQIKWENSGRPPVTLFVQSLEKYQDLIYPHPDSFLIACLVPAWHVGERRIRIVGSLCPVLLHNLQGVFLLLKTWYPNDFGPIPEIEAIEGLKPLLPFNKGAISLLSGGIDSLSILRANKLNFPSDHPDSIKAVLCVGYRENKAVKESDFFEQLHGRLSSTVAVAQDAGVTIIPVNTNTWWLNPNGYFFGQKSFGSQLIAITSFFSKGFHKGFIASSYDAAYLHKPWGSHPQLDSYYSSSHFQIQHMGTEMTRLKKVALVADWPVGFQSIRVCQNDNTGSWNCGTCEKCIRTILMLEALGKLKDCTVFPRNTIDSELLSYLDTYDMLHSTDKVHDDEKMYLYRTIIPHLEKRERFDLIETLEKILQRLYERQKAA